MLPAIDVHKRRHGASTNVHATAPKRGCRVSILQVRSTLLWFSFAVEFTRRCAWGDQWGKNWTLESGLSLLDVQVGALGTEGLCGAKDRLSQDSLGVLALRFVARPFLGMAVNLIGCLITGAGVLSN